LKSWIKDFYSFLIGKFVRRISKNSFLNYH